MTVNRLSAVDQLAVVIAMLEVVGLGVGPGVPGFEPFDGDSLEGLVQAERKKLMSMTLTNNLSAYVA
jgi:hypothetical protein